jgi:hypothetical protein
LPFWLDNKQLILYLELPIKIPAAQNKTPSQIKNETKTIQFRDKLFVLGTNFNNFYFLNYCLQCFLQLG